MTDNPNNAEPKKNGLPSESRPATAVAALMISLYSAMMIIGIHVYDIFFAAKGPGGAKYYVTLGIAAVSAVYVAFHGRALTRKWLPSKPGEIVLTPRETVLVIAVLMFYVVHLTWLVGP